MQLLQHVLKTSNSWQISALLTSMVPCVLYCNLCVKTTTDDLGTVGAVLGSLQTQSKGEGEGAEGGNVKCIGVHVWRQLRLLEVEFQGKSTDFSLEEVGFFQCLMQSKLLVLDIKNWQMLCLLTV